MPNTLNASTTAGKQPEEEELPVNHLTTRLRVGIGSSLLATLPIVSYLFQWRMSVASGTESIFFRHSTVTVVDWVFIPFNFFVFAIIDWSKGLRLYIIFIISLVLNVLTHAYWQYHHLDLGHMITSTGIVLPAGWVHLIFSSLEMVLLVAFIFCRNRDVNSVAASVFATIYFCAMAVAGYAMHRGFIASDVIVFCSGLFFVVLYWPLRQLFEVRKKD